MEILTQSATNPEIRIAIVGIGNDLNGDDGVGIEVVKQLQQKSRPSENFLLLNGGSVPENLPGPLRKFSPDSVILIDAADFNGLPGEVMWLDIQKVTGNEISTHSLPLKLLVGFLEKELKAKIHLLGIQPQHLEFDQGISEECQKSVKKMVTTILHFTKGNIGKNGNPSNN